MRLAGTDVFVRLARSYGFEEAVLSCIEQKGVVPVLEQSGFFALRRPIAFPGSGGAFLRVSGALSLLARYSSLGLEDQAHPLKFFFSGPVFFSRDGDDQVEREECGVAVIGEPDPIAEAIVVHVLWKTLQEQGASTGITVCVNQTGCGQCRPHVRSALLSYVRPRTPHMCKACRDEARQNPFRIFGCGEESCRGVASAAPQTLDFLCEGCKKHLRGFLEFLDEMAIPYSLNSQLFREGLWFDGLLFEFMPSREVGSDGGETDHALPGRALCEGGRISHAAECLIGKRMDAVGGTLFPAVVQAHRERIRSPDQHRAEPGTVFLAHLGDLAKRKSIGLIEMLRKENIPALDSFGRESIRAQLKTAERLGVDIALILGQKEALDQTIIVRDVRSGMQEVMPQEKLTEFLKKRMKR